jgi:Rieske Fe-S protein
MSTEHENDRPTMPGISRRSLLAAGAIGIPGVALVACSQAKAPAGSGPLAKLSDIKVGEAISAKGPDGPIIITRPTETTVAALSAICTHQSCEVKPAGTELDCPCHGSVYDLTGAVLNGPAQRPLRAVKVTLAGDDVIAG